MEDVIEHLRSFRDSSSEKIVFAEFRGHEHPSSEIGQVGDIYIRVDPEELGLFARLEREWRCWPGPECLGKDALQHPYCHDRFLWCSKIKSRFGWVTEQAMTKDVTAQQSAVEVISSVLSAQSESISVASGKRKERDSTTDDQDGPPNSKWMKLPESPKPDISLSGTHATTTSRILSPPTPVSSASSHRKKPIFPSSSSSISPLRFIPSSQPPVAKPLINRSISAKTPIPTMIIQPSASSSQISTPVTPSPYSSLQSNPPAQSGTEPQRRIYASLLKRPLPFLDLASVARANRRVRSPDEGSHFRPITSTPTRTPLSTTTLKRRRSTSSNEHASRKIIYSPPCISTPGHIIDGPCPLPIGADTEDVAPHRIVLSPDTPKTAHIADPPSMLMKHTSFVHAGVNTDQIEVLSASVTNAHVDDLLKELARLREENECLRRRAFDNQGEKSSVDLISVGTQCFESQSPIMMSETHPSFSSPIMAPAEELSQDNSCPPLLPPLHFSPVFDFIPSPTTAALKVTTSDHTIETTLSIPDRSSSRLDVQTVTEKLSLNHLSGENSEGCDVALFTSHQNLAETLSNDPVPALALASHLTQNDVAATGSTSMDPVTESLRKPKEEHIEISIPTPSALVSTRLSSTATVEVIDLTHTDDETDEVNDTSSPIKAIHSEARPRDGTPDLKPVNPVVFDRDNPVIHLEKERLEDRLEGAKSVVVPEKSDVAVPGPRVDEVPAIPMAIPDTILPELTRGVTNGANPDDEVSATDHIVPSGETVHVEQVDDRLPVVSEPIREEGNLTFPVDTHLPAAPLIPELAGAGSPLCSPEATPDEVHANDRKKSQSPHINLPFDNDSIMDVSQEPEVKVKDEPEESTGSIVWTTRLKPYHLDIIYHNVKDKQRFCRFCLRAEPTRMISFSRTAPLNDLVGHAESEHPDACRRLTDMSSEEVDELLRLIHKNSDEESTRHSDKDESSGGGPNGSDEAGRSPPVKKSRMSLDKRLALNGSSNVIDIDVRSLRSAFLPPRVYQNKTSKRNLTRKPQMQSGDPSVFTNRTMSMHDALFRSTDSPTRSDDPFVFVHCTKAKHNELQFTPSPTLAMPPEPSKPSELLFIHSTYSSAFDPYCDIHSGIPSTGSGPVP